MPAVPLPPLPFTRLPLLWVATRITGLSESAGLTGAMRHRPMWQATPALFLVAVVVRLQVPTLLGLVQLLQVLMARGQPLARL